MAEFRMPSLGADMDEGTLLEWLVHPGDAVKKGDVVAVVDTAKAAVEVECFSDGVVEELLVEPGTTVAVGTPLATLNTASGAEPTETVPPEPLAAPTKAPVTVPAARAASPAGSPLPRHRAKVGAAGTRSRPRVSPYARRLAAEHGVDLEKVTPTDGVVRARDVAAAPSPPPPPRPAPAVAATSGRSGDERMREAIARLMSRSNTEVPHYYLREPIDLRATTEWLREHNLAKPVSERVVPAAVMLAAAARAARDVPALNGYWVDGRFEPHASVHLGVAVSLRSGGMVTPALHDAESLSVPELMARLRDLVERARHGGLRASELTDATITVTNLGDQGVEEVQGVIYPPQVALVGFGKVHDRPWAVDGLLGVRPVVMATLAADHRATDGYVGARYLTQLAHHLQHPEEL